MQHHIIKSLAALALGAMLLVSCSKEEPNEGSVNPTPGQETVSFVGTHWEGALEFNDTVSGQVLHLKYLRTLEFYTDSTGLMEQTMLSPWNGGGHSIRDKICNGDSSFWTCYLNQSNGDRVAYRFDLQPCRHYHYIQRTWPDLVAA